MAKVIIMSRTTLDIDDALLSAAKAATGEKSIKGTVEHALRDVVRRKKLERLASLRGSGVIDMSLEDLEKMRRDE